MKIVNNLVVCDNILDLIGRTPMVKINKLTSEEDATILAKLEWYNAGGSVKDRMALFLIEYAEASGKLDKEKTILEASSGNTGIALAMIAAVKGYKVKIVMPESVSIERRKIIKAYGAELVLSPGEKGTAGAIELKQKILRENPEKYVDLDQFKDPANILAHYQTTGKEILEQTEGKLNMVVVGIGTAGTGVGTSMRIKNFNKEVKIVGITPKLGVSIQGIRNPREENPTQLFRGKWFDEIYEISSEEIKKTFEVARRLAREEGILVGMSSAAIMYVALKKAKELGRGKTIVAVLPDGGEKYLSTPIYED
ncbi:MAG: PLP-dependent cysteine synthase family protein [Thermoproteota archaeon]|nr:PLP-dependent cysteine synthase family protein [Candidatus Brockarchaeota archaeon]MBO3768633.1 PLP-dependent cysteine synthase family protein [Candidatus Brockarchaeota archaeon]MBO3802104.1 PLP-dependent cysteine synthase family protein [Candidatus Brockarchaeota archaeon]